MAADCMSPDPVGISDRSSSCDALKSFAALVMADEALAARLAAVDDPDAFIVHAMCLAQSHDIVLPEASLRNAVQPDPLGLGRWSDAPFAGSPLPPRHWLPTAMAAASGATYVDWGWLGPKPLGAPFYEGAVRSAWARPFNRVFRYRTGLQDLIAQAETADSLKPSGFIFHMSRCGSTLAAQMLAALSDCVVISEAAPIDAVVQLGRALAPDDAVRALRAMVAAFGRKRAGHERRYVVKLDCWHTLALPLFRRAFPDVPWVFLYRDPVEVLVSQMRQRGTQMVPQYMPPSFFGLDPAGYLMDEDYCARVLGVICRAVIDHPEIGRQDLDGGLILNYRQLPDAVCSAILPHFGMPCGEEERLRMGQIAQQDAKSPTLPFASDTDSKQREATDKIRRAADRHLGEIYNRLEALNELAAG
jgi:hypothetical protein